MKPALEEALNRYRGGTNDHIRALIEAVDAGQALANIVDEVLDGDDGLYTDDGPRLEDALDEYIKVVGDSSLGIASGRTSVGNNEAQNPPRVYSGQDMVGDPGPWEATSPDLDAPSYDIEIIDQGFEPGTYGGWTIQFKAVGAPRLSYQKSDPILEAFIRLERAPENAPRLGSGGSTALATREPSDLGDVMTGGGVEGNVLRGFTGAAVVEVAPVAIGNAPIMPSDEVVAEACGKAIRAHVAAVAEERKRLSVTENVESIVGRKMTVKG